MAQDAAPYNAIIAHFESHGETALESLLRLGIENRVPLGIVGIDDRLCKNKIDIAVDGESALSTANGLLKGIDGYEAILRDNTIDIEPQVMPPNSAQVLNLVIEQYIAPPSSMQMLGLYLWRYVYAIFHPTEGTIIDVLSGATIQTKPFEMHNAAVVQILNRIVKEGGGGIWVLPPIPDDYRVKHDFKLADVSSYTDDEAKIRKISCAQ
jgi:hypothetical protein